MSPPIPGSLWPPDIKADVQSPRTILDLQAKALSRQTNEVLLGEVQTSYDKEKGTVFVSLDIVVPALNGLRRRLLTASHRTDMIYPVKVEAACFADGRLEVDEFGRLRAPRNEAASDNDFRDLLAKVLRSDEVKAIAVSLVARANEIQTSAERRGNGERASPPSQDPPTTP
jgi:hypothetical protein